MSINEVFCGNITFSDIKSVMKTVVKIDKFVSSLTHSEFRTPLEEMEVPSRVKIQMQQYGRS